MRVILWWNIFLLTSVVSRSVRCLQSIWNFRSHRYFFVFDLITSIDSPVSSSSSVVSWEKAEQRVKKQNEREKKTGRKKLILSFRVSRCQGVMFYLKENNLRYWSGGVCMSRSLPVVCARTRSSDQTHVNIIFLHRHHHRLLSISLIRVRRSLYLYWSEECRNDVLSCTVDFSLTDVDEHFSIQ